jgi:hypothetical protein
MKFFFQEVLRDPEELQLMKLHSGPGEVQED